jgi:hypothetical protein
MHAKDIESSDGMFRHASKPKKSQAIIKTRDISPVGEAGTVVHAYPIWKRG